MAEKWTIGICHPAYQIEPWLCEGLPSARIFQESTPENLGPRMAEVDILVISGAWKDYLLNDATRLQWIQSISVGINQFPLTELKGRQIRLTNAAGVNANAVSEHAMALVLSLTRRLGEARDHQQRRFWRPMIADTQQREFELKGKTLGIVGLGAIGNRLAALAKAFGMMVIGTKRDPRVYHGPADEVLPAGKVDTLFDRSQIVVLACPLTADTENLVGCDQLQRLGPQGYLINVARGAVVDETALVDSLMESHIAGAALDVTVEEPLPEGSPLWGMPNVVITPHTGGETAGYEAALTALILENLGRLERKEPLRNEITCGSF